MPIAETVVTLANSIAEARSPLSDWERSLHSALVELPSFRDSQALDEWEAAFQAAWRAGMDAVVDPDSYFQTSCLLREVFELGRYNLYTAFDACGTRGLYCSLVRELQVHHGITVPSDLDVSEW